MAGEPFAEHTKYDVFIDGEIGEVNKQKYSDVQQTGSTVLHDQLVFFHWDYVQ